VTDRRADETTTGGGTGKVALVTGAASGIGRAAARVLAARGWALALADVDETGLAEFAGPGPAGHLVRGADVSSSEAVRGLVAAAVERFGHIDAVANIAGITRPGDGPVEHTAESDFDRIVAVNLRGPFLVCKYAIPHLRAAGGGCVVNVGSVASVRGYGGTAYVASKSGLAGLSRAVAYHYAGANIRCNTIAPGFTDTPMARVAAAKPGPAPRTPGTLPGMAEPHEIAELLAYLLSPAGRFINGALYTVDGGLAQH
jgi:NAD(P)-dependent dehydrogenase (short-subunit alcohol dehydrogenase family)